MFVQRVQAFKTGRGEMEVSYFNPLYAHGVQQFDVCLLVLLRAEGYLLARLENDVGGAETRAVVFCPVGFNWLRTCCPTLLAAWPPEKFGCGWKDDDVSAYLDKMYRHDGPYQGSGCTAEAEPEDEWLMACALRFDGYLYARRNNLSEQSGDVLDWFLRSPDFYREPAFLMAAMFMLQRGLMKEGVRGKTSQGWRRFRQLFLQLCNQPIPSEYRHGSFYERWDREFQQRLREGQDLIQRLHEAATYGSHLY